MRSYVFSSIGVCIQMYYQDRSRCPNPVCPKLSPGRTGHWWAEGFLSFTRAANTIRRPMDQVGRSASILNRVASCLLMFCSPIRIHNYAMLQHRTITPRNTAETGHTCHPIYRRLQRMAKLSELHIGEESQEKACKYGGTHTPAR